MTPPEDMFWGDRMGSITDPFGHIWQIATHVEDVPEEEMGERAKKWQEEMANAKARPVAGGGPSSPRPHRYRILRA